MMVSVFTFVLGIDIQGRVIIGPVEELTSPINQLGDTDILACVFSFVGEG